MSASLGIVGWRKKEYLPKYNQRIARLSAQEQGPYSLSR
ncbi:hypothetical protein SAMN05216452_2631 [Nitratireductor aquibiodomus]|uniref:Uncharacterized protein n=1 Tax=Nitratireductor aquibiodomus TaxID=204799 RepID=A0A1H4L3Z3_9HYPH|nr:hypothetical protein SAMN05216452_2631 [Nitratireductor aquibiodomus]